MGMKTFVCWAIGAIAVWVVGVLVLYGIIYVDWGADFWHPLR